MIASSENRHLIRQQLRQKRLALSNTDHELYDAIICQKILALPIFAKSQHIAFYMSHDGEVNPQLILKEAQSLKKNCYLPVLNADNTLLFYRYQENMTLVNNRFGIAEPESMNQSHISIQELDLVLMPLVGFDHHGNRLGRGKGYYDRTFADLQDQEKPILLGLAYDFQKLTKINPSHWDVPMHAIMTEQQFYLI